jgi:two-component system LytT family response regulator
MPTDTPRLRAIVVDDEESARDLLCEYLAAHPEVEIVARCANGFEAVKAVTELAPDLLFLDVQMPKLSGFEVLELLGIQEAREAREKAPAVIFTTAWDQYAVQAFEVHAVDYLLKPFPPERLAAALARAGERLARGEPPSWEPLVQANRRDRPYLDRILVREESRIVVLPVERLDYAEARDDSVLLKAGGERHLKPQTLSELEAALDPARFVRVHRSYLLNVERLERLELYAKDSRVAILVDGTRLPVSRTGYARLKELL